MPFQYFVAENLRKFLQYTRKIDHADAFKAAHKSIAKHGTCFVATAVYNDENALEVQLLQKFRNEFLLQKKWGQKFIIYYYQCGPHLAKPIQQFPLLQRVLKKVFTPLALALNEWAFQNAEDENESGSHPKGKRYSTK